MIAESARAETVSAPDEGSQTPHSSGLAAVIASGPSGGLRLNPLMAGEVLSLHTTRPGLPSLLVMARCEPMRGRPGGLLHRRL
jgi:hypothetical protein